VKYLEKKLAEFANLVHRAKTCSLCSSELSHPPRPIISLAERTKVLIISQAPGLTAYKNYIPFIDPSGTRLRQWLGVDKETFYKPELFSIMPMGFCFPGYKNGADAPPMKICAPTWHESLLQFVQPELTILIGRYAQQYYLPHYKTLTEAIKTEHNNVIALPHPSGRNNRWLAKNPWFETQTVPTLQKTVAALIA
jgi:uracil-DNA glycosylase family 4